MAKYNEKILDETQVETLKHLFNDKFKDLISSYLEDTELKEKELLLEIENKRFENARKIAHAIKGNSLNVGAVGLANACEKMETAAKSGNYQSIIDEFHSFQKLYPSTKERYSQFTT